MNAPGRSLGIHGAAECVCGDLLGLGQPIFASGLHRRAHMTSVAGKIKRMKAPQKPPVHVTKS